MSLIRITNPNELRGVHVVMLGLLGLAVVGACLLTSPDKPTVLHDGAREWDPDSLTLALVEVFALQYAAPTPQGIAVKGLAHGVASGLGIIIAVAGLLAWSRSDAGDESDTVIDVQRVAHGADESAGLARRQLDSIRTAQALLLALVAWSFASMLWSGAPQYAWGGAVLLAAQVAWAYALGFGLNRRAATYGGYALLIILAATAAMAIAYRGVRNPTLRASYPVGNPIMLASCLLPGVLIALMTAGTGLGDVLRGRTARGAAKVVLCAGGLALLLFAMYLTSARGPALGLGVGLAGLVFFAGNRRVRQVTAAVTLVGLILAGGYFYSQRFAYSATGRSDSLRERFYTWSYALDLLQVAPVRGLGQGAYALQADALAVQDVLADPGVLEARIAHAHNEWLEIAADLGSVGAVLMLAALLVTLHGGARAVSKIGSRAERWMLVALLATLAGLMVAECFGVGLRIVGLPMVFYTIVGLIWALAGPPPARIVQTFARRPMLGVAALAVALVAGLAIVETSRRDFAAARSAYDVEQALRQEDWKRAESLARKAFEDRLSPYRKLEAAELQVGADGRLAEFYQEQYLRRRALSIQGNKVDDYLAAQAQESRKLCLQHIAAGRLRLRDILAAAPSPYRFGGLEYGFLQLLGVFAKVDEDADQLAEYHVAAAEALALELARKPFNPELAVRLALARLPQFSPEELVTLLARPLRRNLVSPAYRSSVRQIAQTEVFAAALPPIFAAARSADPGADPAQWENPWLPEVLRLEAMTIASGAQRGDAVAALEQAAAYYGLIANRAPLARAACLAELAEARFLENPDDPASAIAQAEEAVKAAPDSEDGRTLVASLRGRLVAYHLASGHEDFARKLIRDRAPQATEEEIATLLANAYVDVAYQTFNRLLSRAPELIESWSHRALELDPQSAPAWFLAADLALQHREEQKAVFCINEVLARHHNLEDVMELCVRGMRALPRSTEIRKLYDRVAARLQSDAPAPSPSSSSGQPSLTANPDWLPTAIGTSGVAPADAAPR